MSQEKRLILFFAISISLLWLWSAIFFKAPPKPAVRKPAAATPAPAQAAAPASAGRPRPAPVALPVEQGAKAEEITVEKGLYRIIFSTQGAVVKSWVLKKYTDEHDKPLDVVNQAACDQLGYPMRVTLSDGGLADKLNSAIYVAKPTGGTSGSPDKLEFTYSDGKIQIRKMFSFAAAYEIRAETSVFDGDRNLPVGVAWPGGFGDHSLAPELASIADMAFYQTTENDKIVTDHITPSILSRWFGSGEKGPQEVNVRGSLGFAGLEDSYFAAVFLPDSPGDTFQANREAWTPADWKGSEKEKPSPMRAVLATAQPSPLSFRLLVAPKDLDVLRGVKPPVDGLVDFGWFKFVAEPLFLGLRYVHARWVHNYGWAIIILTVFLNLAMFPLKLKGLKSAQEMQKIAPIVKEIQERYKQYKFNDPRKQRMNEEIMKLYKEHHVNPVGGCLPMLLQLPLLYGFYRVLQYSIELRHAPWIGCVKDLSAPDQCYLFGIHVAILPTIMVVTMFLAQKMTPTPTADPAQQRMMMLMPLVFGLMFYRLASGVVLYYLVANLVAIGQQLLINKFFPSAAKPKGPPPARSRPPVEKTVSVG
jgi:YidC/Oxa1 family membrane protein insertase